MAHWAALSRKRNEVRSIALGSWHVAVHMYSDGGKWLVAAAVSMQLSWTADKLQLVCCKTLAEAEHDGNIVVCLPT